MSQFTPASVPVIGLDSAPVNKFNPNSILSPSLSGGRNTCVLLGDSLTARCNTVMSIATGNVVGSSAGTTITTSGQSVLDGKVNLSQSGNPALDHMIVQATNVDSNVFTVPIPTSGNPPSALAVSVQTQMSERGWFTWLNALTGQRFYLLNNAAIGGETVGDMALRLDRDVIAYGPAVCFIMAGANDCAAGTAAATTFAKLQAIYERLIPYGIRPILLTVLPLYTGHANFATAMPLIQQLNQLIKNYAFQNNLMCIDAYAAIVDPASATGAALVDTLESDNIHTSAYGARLIGLAGSAMFTPQTQTPPGLTASQVDNFGANSSNWQLFDQAPWTSSGGTVSGTNMSGTAPTGFTVQLTAGTVTSGVVSVPARVAATDGDTIGNNVQVVITASGTATIQIFPSSVRTRLVVGGTYQFRVPVRLTNVSGSNIRAIQFQMTLTGANSQQAIARAWGNESSVALATNYADGTYYMYSPVFTVPSWFTSTSNGFAILQITFSAAGTAITVNCGRWTMQRLS